jgi:DNA replication protein DnaC
MKASIKLPEGVSLFPSPIANAERQKTIALRDRAQDLVDDLYAGLADGSYEQRMRRWCRPQMLVIDDVGLGQLKRQGDEPTAAHMLFTLLDRRHTNVSTALTSNLKLSAWGKYLGDATLAAAVLDRLAATSIRVDIDGPSYRQFLAHKRAQENGAVLPVEPETEPAA